MRKEHEATGKAFLDAVLAAGAATPPPESEPEPEAEAEPGDANRQLAAPVTATPDAAGKSPVRPLTSIRRRISTGRGCRPHWSRGPRPSAVALQLSEAGIRYSIKVAPCLHLRVTGVLKN